MLRKLLPRTRTAFESRTKVWREVGLGSEIDPAAARRSKGGALLLLALIAAVLAPMNPRDGGKLAEELLAGLRGVDGGGANGNAAPEPA
jgi:hypothetical protein